MKPLAICLCLAVLVGCGEVKNEPELITHDELGEIVIEWMPSPDHPGEYYAKRIFPRESPHHEQ